MSVTELRGRANQAAVANRAYNDGKLGYYAVNESTQIAVAGPFADELTAQREADKRNAEPPFAPHRLVVVQMARSS